MSSALLAIFTIVAGGLIRLFSAANPRNPAMTRLMSYGVMAAGVVLLLVALFLSWGGVSGIGYLAWGGLLLFIVGYALFFVKPPSAKPVEKRWRGRPVDDSPDGSWWDRLRRRGR